MAHLTDEERERIERALNELETAAECEASDEERQTKRAAVYAAFYPGLESDA